MINHDKYTALVQWHNAIQHFNYDLAIDWAIEFIKRGQETEHILIVASFSKPVDSYEIKPYISGAIRELNLEEKYSEYSEIANIHYHVQLILENSEVRLNLKAIYKMYDFNCYALDNGLHPFYLLYHAWSSLEQDGYNHYYKGATIENILDVLQEASRKWIEKYVNKK